jgi:hypothetical protein
VGEQEQIVAMKVEACNIVGIVRYFGPGSLRGWTGIKWGNINVLLVFDAVNY